MGKLQKVLPVKLFAGLIADSNENIENALKRLKGFFGPVDAESRAVPFDFTEYYAQEMGINLLRKWVSFQKLINPETLSKIKLKTNRIEERLSLDGKRKVNIDPGYINQSKVVLASTKDFSHRIYLSKKIYAEITLIYKQKEFTSLPWTYPDYKSKAAQEFLNRAREIFSKQLEQ